MAISDKLNYLIETKQLFKGRLNSLGAEIVESTTFRNYLSWLDNFFEKASDKTDLANNGIVGSTGQNGTPTPTNPIEIKNKSGRLNYKVSGKNLFDVSTNTDGKVLSSNGRINDDVDFTVSDYIKVTPNTSYTISWVYDSSQGSDTAMRVGYFQSDKTFISRPYTTTSPYLITTPNDCYYIRICYEIASHKQVQVELNSTATEYEPYIEPRTFPLNLKSKNLFDKDNISNNEWLLANGTTESHNDFCVSDYIPIKENTDYYLPMTNTRRLKYYDSEKQPLATNDWDIARSTVGQVITTPNNANYVRITIHTAVVDINTFQFEESSTPTDYELYYDIELCNISDYKDRIYSQNGEFYLDKNIDKIVLNGNETWYYSTGNAVFYCDIIRDLAISATDYYCSHFLQVSYTTTYANMNNGETKYDSRLTPRLIFKYTDYTTTTGFKSWLSSNNMTIDYILKNPIATTLTEENYPTLYNQLKDILDYLTQYKINNEFLLDYSSPEIEY